MCRIGTGDEEDQFGADRVDELGDALPEDFQVLLIADVPATLAVVFIVT